jgi:hypothetical protein
MTTRRSRDAMFAATLLALACLFDGAFRFVVALPLVIASLVVASLTLRSASRAPVGTLPPLLWMLLAAVPASGIATPGSAGPVSFELLRRSYCALGVVAVGLASGDDVVWRRRAVVGAMIGATALAFITPAVVPHPQIDVVPWTDAAVRAFLNGVHPYTVVAPDIYRGGADFGFDVQVYPYMPATLLAFAPFVAVLGDFRYALAVSVPVTLWLLRRAGAGAGVDGHLVDAATLLVALHPTMPIVVRSGWTEPLMCVVSAGVAVALAERRKQLAAVGMALLPSLKQYAIAPVLLWAAGYGRRTPVRAWVVAALVAAFTIVPFLIWNSSATMSGMVFQMRAPVRPRLSSISIPGLLAHYGSMNIPIWTSAVTQFAIAGVLAVGGVGSTVSGLFAGSAVALLATFLLGWQAFVNYYVWIGLLLVLAAVTDAPERIDA